MPIGVGTPLAARVTLQVLAAVGPTQAETPDVQVGMADAEPSFPARLPPTAELPARPSSTPSPVPGPALQTLTNARLPARPSVPARVPSTVSPTTEAVTEGTQTAPRRPPVTAVLLKGGVATEPSEAATRFADVVIPREAAPRPARLAPDWWSIVAAENRGHREAPITSVLRNGREKVPN